MYVVALVLTGVVIGCAEQTSIHYVQNILELNANSGLQLPAEGVDGTRNSFKALARFLLATKPAGTFNPCGVGLRLIPERFVGCSRAGPSPYMSTATSMPSPFLDEGTISEAAASFPLTPDELISKTKQWILDRNGLDAPDSIAESFEFMGPVVGPLSKSEYLETVGGFNIYDAFPDLRPNFHDFRVDPFEPGRVWFTSRVRGTFTGTFAGSLKGNGEKFEMPPEAISVQWDGEGRVVRYTIGYVTDRARGNSGGLGGAFGILYAVGKGLPFREAQPWSKSLRFRLFNFVGNFAQRMSKRK